VSRIRFELIVQSQWK